MDISIVIVNYNSLKLIKNCLESIRKLTFRSRDKKSKPSYEILVIDNKSSDGSIEYLREQDKKVNNLYFIPNSENAGFSKASNMGALKARGKYLLFLNPDTEFLKGDLKDLMDFYDRKNRNGRAGAIGAKVLNPDESLQYTSRSFPTLARQFYESYFLSKIFKKSRIFGSNFMHWWDHKNEMEVDWLEGSFIFIKKSGFMEAGMFDEDYFMYSEDVDLCLKLYERGLKNYYYPYFIIKHISGAVASRDQIVRETGIWSSRRLYFKKNYSKTHAILLSLIYLAGILNRILLFIILSIFVPLKRHRVRLSVYLGVLKSYFGSEGYGR